MEEPREQYPRSTPPPPQYVAPSAMAYHAAPASSRVDVGGRLVRLVLRRALWIAEQVWLLLRPRLGWVLLTAFLVGVISFLGLLLVATRLVRSEPAETRVALIEPAPSVVDFLRAQQAFDADTMWASFSPSFQESLQERDLTRDTLAEQMESERRAGQRYRKYDYVGGVEIDNNQSMYFYVVETAMPQRSGSRSVSFVFTVDRDGKIAAVE